MLSCFINAIDVFTGVALSIPGKSVISEPVMMYRLQQLKPDRIPSVLQKCLLL